MLSRVQLARPARRFLLTAASVAALTALRGQVVPASTESTVALEQYVISASRTPQDPRYTPSSVSNLSLDALHEAQVPTLAQALSEEPGVILHTNGAIGSQASVLMRGANNDQTLFFVDGVRMNDRSATYLNFLGGADLAGLDRLEVLRGPQSTLYGSSAMGGVILMNTAHGSGQPTGTISATGGSFNSYGASAAVRGASGKLGYSASLAGFHTDNDRAKNEYREWTYSSRLEYAVTPRLLVGGTFRGLHGRYSEPGSRLFLSPGTVQLQNALATAYAEARPVDELKSRLTLASHVRHYTWRSPGLYSPQANNRKILDWQNTWTPTRTAEVVAGTNLETSRYIIESQRETDRVSAGYVSSTLRPAPSVTLTAGLRYDRYRSVGSATTGRLGAAWSPAAGTKLRATYGTGFSAPSTSDRYGVPAWGQLPNANLAPEKSKGWDVGFDQEFANGAGLVSVTYFNNKFRNLFEWEYVNFVTYEGRIVNRARASTEGVEFAVRGRLHPRVQARASYTYLEAHNDLNGARLSRRPRHTGNAELRFQATTPWLVGVGGHFVTDNVNGTKPFPGYTTVRAFTSYAVTPDLLLKLRIENALDRKYEQVLGYPALPRGVFGSVDWRF